MGDNAAIPPNLRALAVYECKEGSRCQPSRKEENEEGDTREKVKGRRARGGHLRFDGSDLDVVVQTPVKRNTLVWFINSNVSIHGDAPREVSPHRRDSLSAPRTHRKRSVDARPQAAEWLEQLFSLLAHMSSAPVMLSASVIFVVPS